MKDSLDFEAFIEAGENARKSKKKSQTKQCLVNQKKGKNPYIRYPDDELGNSSPFKRFLYGLLTVLCFLWFLNSII